MVQDYRAVFLQFASKLLQSLSVTHSAVRSQCEADVSGLVELLLKKKRQVQLSTGATVWHEVLIQKRSTVGPLQWIKGHLCALVALCGRHATSARH